MTRRAAAIAVLAAFAAAAPGASAQTAPVSAARLEGSFLLAGRVTTAVNVLGERRGQTFTRTWTFTPDCPAGPCSSVTLSRPRAGGSDTVVLTERSAGHYVGSGQFYAPLRCSGRLYPRGQSVPFNVAVTITTAIVNGDGSVVAGRINATYINRARSNLTPCVEPPSHDAASYHGHLSSSG
jgi:hypothetical protein